MLVEHMNALEPLTPADLARLRNVERERTRQRFMDRMASLAPEGGTIIGADYLPPTAFAAPGSANDIDEQISVLSRNFNTFIRTGWTCPPNAAWRIAVILRRMKRDDLEHYFLAAWVRHFPDGKGSRYRSLSDRYARLAKPDAPSSD